MRRCSTCQRKDRQAVSRGLCAACYKRMLRALVLPRDREIRLRRPPAMQQEVKRRVCLYSELAEQRLPLFVNAQGRPTYRREE